MVMPYPSSAFFVALQADNIEMAVAIDLFTPADNYFWTTQNDDVSLDNSSGDLTTYRPFPGIPLGGQRRGTDLKIATMQMVVANSGGVFDSLILGKELSRSEIVLRRYFTNTPGFGTVDVMRGKIGDYSWNRDQIVGSVRDRWDSANQKFPYYNFQDNCIWKFGSAACGFDTSSVTITLSVDVSSSTQLKIMCASGSLTQSYANDFFTFGKFTATGGVNSGQVRTVRAHSGDQLDMSHQFGGLVNSLSADVFPGCRKRRVTDCASKYDNEVNFNGHEWIPIQENAF
ncbi:MAG: phage BR0599 family protein [Nitrospiraceae bacterium]